MVGVFISVTTVPAAGNLALGIALWETGEIVGSLTQLGVNVACMIVSGSLVLAGMRSSWAWVTAGSERLFGGRASHHVGGVSTAVIFPKFRGDLVASAAVAKAMHDGAVEATKGLVGRG